MDSEIDTDRRRLTEVAAGTPVVVGDWVVPMPETVAGDRVVAVARTGDLLVVGEAARRAATAAVDDAHAAFAAMTTTEPGRVDAFFDGFAALLDDDSVWDVIAAANAADVERARTAGRFTNRLPVSDKMRAAMVDGLRGWAGRKSSVGRVVERREGPDYVLERRVAPLGVVAFVFEGRPNVFADGVGVLRNGNTAVMRIGGDALGTAEAIEQHALAPALAHAGLPAGAVRLVRSRDRAAGQALFTLPQVRLAVARGSGPTVALLGSIAEQHGIPASLHGTGGAWMYVDATATPAAVENAVSASLDRKVCNTLNTLVLDTAAIEVLGPVVAKTLESLDAVVHVAAGSSGVVAATGTSDIPIESLSREYEWEGRPELAFVTADGLPAAARLVNDHSPHFVASILTTNPGAFEQFYDAVDAPYVGAGFTRWVDGQWAWQRPELGLTNWERGRLLGRSGILSGDDIVTVRDVFLDRSGEARQAR